MSLFPNNNDDNDDDSDEDYDDDNDDDSDNDDVDDDDDLHVASRWVFIVVLKWRQQTENEINSTINIYLKRHAFGMCTRRMCVQA